ncbi:hypothetical protein MMC11_003082 [Xylographa trunciseda]|nr:hypothetical protein [Xylographa trunciseda]
MAEAGEQFATDDNILEKIDGIERVLKISGVANSAWAKAFRVDAQLRDGHVQSYFLKISIGHHGCESLMGEFESTSAIYSISPDFVPKPIAWGSCKSVSDTHFYLAEFKNLALKLPESASFCERLAELHKNGVSPSGKFGFHVTTYNGDLPQENSFTDTWEEFFANGLRHMFKLNVELAGPCKQLEVLMPKLFDKVIPRLLRPIEPFIKPSLVHGDLWCGNAAVNIKDGKPIVFDPCCFWAHNEYEFGNWRPKRNMFTEEYFAAYQLYYPKAIPEEDYDDRNALYAM